MFQESPKIEMEEKTIWKCGQSETKQNSFEHNRGEPASNAHTSLPIHISDNDGIVYRSTLLYARTPLSVFLRETGGILRPQQAG